MGIVLEDSPNVVFIVYNNSETSLVVEVKSKQYLYPLLIELNKSVHRKFNESFSCGNGVFRYQGILCVPYVDYLRNQILEESHGS